MLLRRGPCNLYSILLSAIFIYVVYRCVSIWTQILAPRKIRTVEACLVSMKTAIPNIIPSDMHEFVQEIARNDQFEMLECRYAEKKKKFAFLKVQRCATETLSAVFRRFALENKQTVVLPVGIKSYLGWPHFLNPIMYRKSQDGRYDILLDQTVYNRTEIYKLLPPEAVYFANLREPFSRLKSALVVGGMKTCGLMDESIDDVTAEFLNNMEVYDRTYMSPSNLFNITACRCIKKGVSIAKNAMAFDLGFPTGFHIGIKDRTHDYEFIKRWLETINNEINFFMLQERFDESMVFLKRYMCWSFKDILYKSVDYSNPIEKPDIQYDLPKIGEYRNWNNVDTLLYKMATIIFDKRVKSLGDDFGLEVIEFQRQLKAVTDFCLGDGTGSEITMHPSKWDSGYTVTREECRLIFDWHYVKDMLKNDFTKNLGFHSDNMIEGYNYNAWC